MTDGSAAVSRPSETNRHAPAQTPETSKSHIGPDDMGATALRPISVDPDRQLRDEARAVELDNGATVPMTSTVADASDGSVKSRQWYRVVNAHTEWYRGYLNSHIEFEDSDGETVRGQLENSYQPQYGDRYYARLMDLKRGIERQWGDFSTVMLTLSASTLNQQDQPRAPADHMRDIAEAWDTARKQLYDILSGRTWCYARIWEPTSDSGHGPAGYGHMHVALFVEDGRDLESGEFRPFMESYVANCQPAGWEAHRPSGDSVSITHDLDNANVATYISEYIGQYGEHLTERPIHERAFLAAAWATGTRRVEFSNNAQEIITGEEFRRETGLRPEDRGQAESDSEAAESDERESAGEGEGQAGYTFKSICTVENGQPEHYEPTDGGVQMGPIEGAPRQDRPKDLGPPPGGGNE